MRWWLLAPLLCSCESAKPDVVGVFGSRSSSEDDTSFHGRSGPRFTTDGDSDTVGGYLEWHIGARTRHRESLTTLREGQAILARLETIELAHAHAEGIVVNVPHSGTEEGPPEEDGWSTLTKALTALGASLAALVAAWLQMRRGKPPASEEETEG